MSWSMLLLSRVADTLVLSTAFLAFMLLLRQLVRTPAMRMALAWGTLIGLAALAAAPWLPARPRFPLTAFSREARNQTSGTSNTVQEAPMPERRESPASTGMTDPLLAGMETGPSSRPDHAATENVPETATSTRPAAIVNVERPVSGPSAVTPSEGLAAGWLAGAGLCLAWIALGSARALWLLRRAKPAPEWAEAELRGLVGSARRAPGLRITADIAAAVALGTLRPRILLPEPAAGDENRTAVRSALAHEWAHIRHGDLWLLALERLLLPVYFAQPLYWCLRRWVRIDQELLADAEAAGDAPVEYAESLVAWAKLASRRTAPFPAGLAALSLWDVRTPLTRRVEMLLDASSPVHRKLSRRGHWLTACLTLVPVLGLSLCTLQSTAAPPEATEPPVPKAKSPEPSVPVAKGATAAPSATAPQKDAGPRPPAEQILVIDSQLFPVDQAVLAKGELSLGDMLQKVSDGGCRLEDEVIVAVLSTKTFAVLERGLLEVKALGTGVPGLDLTQSGQTVTLTKGPNATDPQIATVVARVSEKNPGTTRLQVTLRKELVRKPPKTVIEEDIPEGHVLVLAELPDKSSPDKPAGTSLLTIRAESFNHFRDNPANQARMLKEEPKLRTRIERYEAAFKAQTEAGARLGAEAEKLEAIADAETNSVFVKGPTAGLEDLIKVLDAPPAKTSSEASTKLAEEKLVLAEEKLLHVKRLVSKGFATQAEQLAAELALEQAKIDVERTKVAPTEPAPKPVAAATSVSVQEKILELDVREAELELQSAESLGKNLMRVNGTIPQNQVREAEFKLAKAKIALERAKLKLEAHRLEHPQAAGPAIRLSPTEQRIHNSLQQPISMHQENAPLGDVIKQIQKLAQVNVHVDELGLQEEMVSTANLVTIKVDEIPIKSALNLVLEPLNLGYVIQNDVVKITSKRRCAGEQVTRPSSVAGPGPARKDAASSPRTAPSRLGGTRGFRDRSGHSLASLSRDDRLQFLNRLSREMTGRPAPQEMVAHFQSPPGTFTNLTPLSLDEGLETLFKSPEHAEHWKSVVARQKSSWGRLGGTWRVAMLNGSDKLTEIYWKFRGPILSIVSPQDKPIGQFLVRVDDGKSPMTVDLERLDEIGHVSRGLLKFEGDRLLLCMGKQDAPRPADFREFKASTPPTDEITYPLVYEFVRAASDALLVSGKVETLTEKSFKLENGRSFTITPETQFVRVTSQGETAIQPDDIRDDDRVEVELPIPPDGPVGKVRVIREPPK